MSLLAEPEESSVPRFAGALVAAALMAINAGSGLWLAGMTGKDHLVGLVLTLVCGPASIVEVLRARAMLANIQGWEDGDDGEPLDQ